MAEILVCVTDAIRPETKYQDGDIVCAWTTTRVEMTHAGVICHPAKAPFTGDGYRLRGGIQEDWCDLTWTLRYERVSPTEVLETDLVTTATRLLPWAGFAASVARHRAHPRHRVFGGEGAEMWYAGHRRLEDANAVWAMLETRTANLRADHQLWPLTPGELRGFLPMKLPDAATEDDCMRITVTEIDYDNQQPEYTRRKTDTGTVGDNIVKKRRGNLNWRGLFNPNERRDILDRAVEFDARDRAQPTHPREFAWKPRANVWTSRDHIRASDDKSRYYT